MEENDRQQLPALKGDGPPPIVAVADCVDSRVSRTPNPALVYLAGLSEGSRPAMGSSLNRIAHLLSGGRHEAADLPWQFLTYAHGQALRSRLAEAYAPATVNRYLSAFKGVMKEAARLGLISRETLQQVTDLKGAKGSRLPAGRALSAAELQRLFIACREDATPAGRRDAAMLALMVGCGLRRAEVVSLNVGNWQEAAGALDLVGKGNKERLAYPNAPTCQALKAWLAVRPEGDPGEALFFPVNKGGRVISRPMSERAVNDVIAKRGQEAGISLTPHDLRRTFITNLLDAGADLLAVRDLAGHTNVQTTARYDRRGENAQRAAAALAPVPYV